MILMQGKQWVFHIVMSRAGFGAFPLFHTAPYGRTSKVATLSPNRVRVVSPKA